MHRIARPVFAEFWIRDSDKQQHLPAGPGSAARPWAAPACGPALVGRVD